MAPGFSGQDSLLCSGVSVTEGGAEPGSAEASRCPGMGSPPPALSGGSNGHDLQAPRKDAQTPRMGPRAETGLWAAEIACITTDGPGQGIQGAVTEWVHL